MSLFSQTVDRLRTTFLSGVTLPLEFRKQQLRALETLVTNHTDELSVALYKDLHKSEEEADLAEIAAIHGDIQLHLEHLGKWAADEYPPLGFYHSTNTGFIRKDPYGVVLLIGPWNYPVTLIFLPLIGALSAGNTVLIKPSEMAPHTARTIAKLIPRYLDERLVSVVQGGVEETTQLLRCKFDHIFFTGSPAVGKIVMTAAAKHLTPVTLELGGKSPVFVDDTADPYVVARRVIFGKLMNSGQTCIAPDYMLCHEDMVQPVVKAMVEAIHEFHGRNVQDSAFYGRIVHSRHWDRIMRLLNGTKGTIAFGGHSDREQLFIEPTIVTGVEWNDLLMSDELFGPILPIITIGKNGFDEAIRRVNEGDQPLALYIFSKNKAFVHHVMRHTRSGGVLINDTIVHHAVAALPFGGVGPSGHGNYHGKASFDTFTHRRSTYKVRPGLEFVNAVRYPPYTPMKRAIVNAIVTGAVDRAAERTGKVVKWGGLTAVAGGIAYSLLKSKL